MFIFITLFKYFLIFRVALPPLFAMDMMEQVIDPARVYMKDAIR